MERLVTELVALVALASQKVIVIATESYSMHVVYVVETDQLALTHVQMLTAHCHFLPYYLLL
tara:strand:- start:5 stop:190 length:186 start_codon:yes stop_codon:yes gene_type:complete